MMAGNTSMIIVFTMAELLEKPEFQLPLFFLFLGMYVVTVTWVWSPLSS
jgi:hypothetical protein